ncbi:MAG: hypothetical protein NTX25_01370, partial [Proteobacteria bacterium]|nr:hypothetical protein [Pseudomonadota bacterium]
SILGLSRLSFKAYISFQKLESLTQYSASPEELKAEKSHLDHCLDEMKVMTGQLLESERAIKTDKAS